MSGAARCPSRTCRASEAGCRTRRHGGPDAPGRGRPGGSDCGGGRRRDGACRRGRGQQARLRPCRRGPAPALHRGNARGFALRTGRTGADRRRRHAAPRDRGPARPAGPATRLRAGGLRPHPRRAGGPGHARGRDCHQRLRPAPHQGRRGARPCAGLPRRQRARRAVQVRRAGDEERDRLRPLEAHGGFARHAGRHERGHRQGVAEARNRGDGGFRRARRCGGGGC